MDDVALLKRNLSEITLKTFEEAISICFSTGIATRAPLGYSGNDILIFGTNNPSRVSLVAVRNHSGMCELLITDRGGNFLVLCKYCPGLTYPVIAGQFMDAFELVKNFIENKI